MAHWLMYLLIGPVVSGSNPISRLTFTLSEEHRQLSIIPSATITCECSHFTKGQRNCSMNIAS